MSISSQQISEEFEILFVDNGSFDESIKYVHKQFPKIKVIALNENSGFAQGNNIGLTNAEGEYLIFINPDTRAEPNWLKNLVDAADHNLEYKILCSIQLPGMYSGIPILGSFFGITKFPYPNTDENIVESNFCDGGCFLLRKSWLHKVRYLFDPSYFCYSEDIDLSLRTILAGGKIGYVKKSVIWHLTGGSQKDSFWACRIDMLNSLRSFQKVFSKITCRKIVLIRGFVILLVFIKLPFEIRRNIFRLTGFVEFLYYRNGFLKKDKTFYVTGNIDEREILKKIYYKGYIGKLVRKLMLKN